MPVRRFFVILIVALGTVGGGAPRAQADAPEPPFCGSGLRPVETPAGRLCTHGGDEAQVRSGDSISDPQLVVPPAPCPGDGISGPRVHVLYGHPSDRPDRYEDRLPIIADAVARAAAYLDASTPSMAGQHIRWACSNGALSVTNVDLLPIGEDGAYTFDDAVTSLQHQVQLGLGGLDYAAYGEIYVLFVDHLAGAYGWAGEASLRNDDTADASNRNNLGRSYSMIAAFDGETVLHEVLHNLGSVQLSAPHSSGGWHCYETNDIMCYEDGAPYFTLGGVMTANCMDAPTWFVDCGGDDYYDLAPAAGAYLADHWNVATSAFLTPPEPLPHAEPTPDPEAGTEAPDTIEPEPTPEPTEPSATPPSTSTCTIRGTRGDDVIRGTSGRDVICAGSGDDEIRALGGGDVIHAGGGRDVAYLGRGTDVVYGKGGVDRLYGGRGKDVLDGGRHRDLCRSGLSYRCEA